MTRTIFIAGALAFAVTLPAAPAQAADRTFVSAAGNDSNPCTITLPCRNFQAAYNAVAANGQIDALDPGNYGPLSITGPVSIQGHGWASMSAPAGKAITIKSPGVTDEIIISGVVLDGLGIVNTTGIEFDSGGTLYVQDSVIRNFGVDGVFFQPNTSNLSQLFVSNTLLSDMGFDGIDMSPGGTGTTNSVLDHVRMQNNGRAGLLVQTPISTQTVNVTVSDSVSAGNGQSGIVASSLNGKINIMVRNCTIANNRFDGLEADGSSATIRVTRSTITGNNLDWFITSPGKVLSYRDNNFDGNTSSNIEPPSLTYK
jgi:Right handed beta helix region